MVVLFVGGGIFVYLSAGVVFFLVVAADHGFDFVLFSG